MIDCKNFDIKESERYQALGLLGRGGMGEVHAVLDLRLDREVALKVLQRSDPQAEARMAREASLAARLEHPGIVPVHGAGRLPDGHAYYTMRVIRGQSLSDALSVARDLPARLRLMRPFLDACDAVAYAHDQGVLHRDLKPANVMMGEHGGTVVVDWGLAVMLDDAPAAPSRGGAEVGAPFGASGVPAEETWAPVAGEATWTPDTGDAPITAPEGPADGALAGPPRAPSTLGTLPMDTLLRTGPAEWELTRPGQVFGTPAFMSPEQARGEALGRPSDVFSLGGVLFQLLTGRPPRQSIDPTEAIPPVLALCPEAPPELVAITNRALHADPTRRYPDAGALAADVGAWFEGRRVNAYTYSRWELLQRLIAAWKVPILVGAVALAALAVAVSVGWWRTVVERNKALQAEEMAVAARAESDRYLAEALVAQAMVAMDRGQRPRAELLAAHRLRYGESPEARGLLARFNGSQRPELLSHWAAPACLAAVLSDDGSRVACRQVDGVRVLDERGREVAHVDRVVRQINFADPSGALLLLSDDAGNFTSLNLATLEERTLTPLALSTPLTEQVGAREVLLNLNARPVIVDLDEGVLRPLPRCGAELRPIGTALRDNGALVLLCGRPASSEISVVEQERSGERRVLFTLDGADGVLTSLVVQEGPRARVLVGSERGTLTVWSRADGRLRSVRTDLPDIAALTVSGDRALVQSVTGWATVWDLDALVPMVRLPDSVYGVVWMDGGARLRTVGRAWHEWAMPAVAMPLQHAASGGVSAVTISPDARLVAWGSGTGEAVVAERETGARVLERQLGTAVVKDVSFSPDGTTLAVGSAAPTNVQLFDTSTGALRAELASRGVRRLAWLGDVLMEAVYRPELLRWAPGVSEPEAVQGVSYPGDLDPLVDVPGVVLLEDGGAVVRLDAPDAAPVTVAHSTTAQAVAGSRRYTYIVDSGLLRRFDRAGAELQVQVDPNRCRHILEVSVSPRDQWIAVGCFTGAVLVYRGSDLRQVATLTGHSGRVSTLDFDASGRWLVSGGWEGQVRVWDMSVLDVPAEALVRTVEAAWGMGLQDAIGD